VKEELGRQERNKGGGERGKKEDLFGGGVRFRGGKKEDSRLLITRSNEIISKGGDGKEGGGQ